MGIKRASLTGGEVFGYLTAIKYSYSSKRRNGKSGERVMKCVCRCGSKIEARASNLYSGNTRSCGCYQAEQTTTSNVSRGATK